MPEGWERYGVEDNIFEAPVLDCVRNGEDRERFGSFFFSGEEEDDFQRQLGRAIKAKALAFYVITGPDGSGRTAFARRLVHRYAQLRGADMAKFAFAEYDPQSNVSPQQVLHRLVTSVANEAKSLTAKIGQDASTDLRASLKANSPASFDEIEIQSELRAFSQTMKIAGGGFGCVLENASRAEMITLARTLFEKSEAIVAITVRNADKDNVVKPLESAGNARFIRVKMPHLTPRQTWDALEHRWKKWQAADEIPLPRPAVESQIAVPPPTMGWLLTQAAMMFDHKLSKQPRGEVWPADKSLAFEEGEVKSVLDYVRKWAKKGQL